MEQVAASTGEEEPENLAPRGSSSTPLFDRPNMPLNFDIIITNLPLPYSASNPDREKKKSQLQEGANGGGGRAGGGGRRQREVEEGE